MVDRFADGSWVLQNVSSRVKGFSGGFLQVKGLYWEPQIRNPKNIAGI